MPKIPIAALKNIVFLYTSEDDARAGTKIGGTGFLVSVPSVDPSRAFLYFVTNWHVPCQLGASVVRVNTRDGVPEIFSYDPSEWIFDTRFDIAVIPATIDFSRHYIACMNAEEIFLTAEGKDEQQIGPGDNVFMVGRFVDVGGRERNNPAVRFENISLDPTPMSQVNGRVASSYCVDMHSRTGFSGSPVYVYRTPGYDLTPPLDEELRILTAAVNHLSLLGIHWGQFPETWDVTEAGELRAESSDNEGLLTGSRYIRGLSGMTCVLPAWHIREVLNLPALQHRRDVLNAALREAFGDPESNG